MNKVKSFQHRSNKNSCNRTDLDYCILLFRLFSLVVSSMTRITRALLLLSSCVLASPVAAFWSTTGDSEAVKTDAQQEHQSLDPLPPPTVPYGVDVSFPIHHATISSNYAWLPHNLDPSLPVPKQYKDMPVSPLPGVAERYENFMKGCMEKFGKRGKACLQTEQDRVEMSLRQPQSMQNYTLMGFKKIRAPPALWNLIQTFWLANKDKATPEKWGVGNTYSEWRATEVERNVWMLLGFLVVSHHIILSHFPFSQQLGIRIALCFRRRLQTPWRRLHFETKDLGRGARYHFGVDRTGTHAVLLIWDSRLSKRLYASASCGSTAFGIVGNYQCGSGSG